jgi:hypothetical protein
MIGGFLSFPMRTVVVGLTRADLKSLLGESCPEKSSQTS